MESPLTLQDKDNTGTSVIKTREQIVSEPGDDKSLVVKNIRFLISVETFEGKDQRRVNVWEAPLDF